MMGTQIDIKCAIFKSVVYPLDDIRFSIINILQLDQINLLSYTRGIFRTYFLLAKLIKFIKSIATYLKASKTVFFLPETVKVSETL